MMLRRATLLALIAARPFLAGADPAPPAAATPATETPASPDSKDMTLTLGDVIASVSAQYPPYLAAMIEQDISNGRLRSAEGAFDTSLNVGTTWHPAGYYDGNTGYAVLDQPLSFWGGSVYGGYRLAGGYLANYNKERTPDDGQAILGFRIPLLKDGTIDARRAKLMQAKIDQQLADPYILRQRLDFVRSATIAYYVWIGAGLKLKLTEELYRVAKERDDVIAKQIEAGAAARIVRVDNERLVVSRQIGLVQARRRFLSAGIELSLFLRNRADATPVIPGIDRLPKAFPECSRPDNKELNADIAKAVGARPEMRRYALTLEKARIDLQLADNAMLPDLSVGAQVNQSVTGAREKDIESTEFEGKVELKVPLERRDAKGRVQSARAAISRIELEEKFARDKVAADVRESYAQLNASSEQLERTARNITLANELRQAEIDKFTAGATDLLALQIREQAAFDAMSTDVDARADYFRALANYRAATAADAPATFDKSAFPDMWKKPEEK